MKHDTTFPSPTEVRIAQEHFRPGPTGEFTSNRGSLHEILETRPGHQACQVDYKKVLLADVAKAGCELHPVSDHTWHLRDHTSTTYVVYREMDVAQPNLGAPFEAAAYSVGTPDNTWQLQDLVRMVCETRDGAFAPEHIENFVEDLTNGSYWLWTRRAIYHILESGHTPTHMLVWATRPEKSLPNGFDVHFRVMRHDSLVGWADQTIVVMTQEPRPRVEEIPTLFNFLNKWR